MVDMFIGESHYQGYDNFGARSTTVRTLREDLVIMKELAFSVWRLAFGV